MVCLLSQHKLKIRISKKVTRPRQLSISHISKKVVWFLLYVLVVLVMEN